MIKILVGVTFGLLGAAITSGCVVRSEPAVVVREPVIVYQPVVVQDYKYKHKRRGDDDQGEDEQ